MLIPKLLDVANVSTFVGSSHYEFIDMIRIDNYLAAIILRVKDGYVVLLARIDRGKLCVDRFIFNQYCLLEEGPKELRVCCQDRCYSLKRVTRIRSTKYVDVFKLICNDKCYVIDNVRRGLEVCDYAELSEGSSLLAVVMKKGRYCRVYVWRKFTTEFKEYLIAPCDDVTKFSCGSELCILCTKNSCYVFDLNRLYNIPVYLTPLVKCGGYDFLYDHTNKLIVKCDGDLLEPITTVGNVKCVECLCDESLVICSGDGTYIVRGGLKVKLGSSCLDISSYESILLYSSSTSCYKVLINGDEANIYLRADKCVVLGDGLVLCLLRSHDKLLLLDIKKLYKPEVRVLRDELSENGYARVVIRPWFITSKFSIDGRVRVIGYEVRDDELNLTLRPKTLGSITKVKIIISDPLYSNVSLVHVKSRKPKLLAINVSKCISVNEGFIGYEFRDTYLHLNVKVLNPTPEEAVLKVDISGLKYVKMFGSFKVKPGVNNLHIDVYGLRSCYGSIITLKFYLSYSDEETYLLGEYVVDVSKCIECNPLTKAFEVSILGENIRVITKIPNIKLSILCCDGSKYEVNEYFGSEHVIRCRAPLAINATCKDGNGMLWFLSRVIDVPSKLVVSSISGNSGIDVLLDSRDSRSLRLVFEVGTPDVDIGIRIVSYEEALLTIHVCRIKVPTILVYRIGDYAEYVTIYPGKDIVIRCRLDDLMLGIDLFLLTPLGKVFQYYLGPKDIVKLLIMLGVKCCLNILKKFGGMLGYSFKD